MCVNSASLHIIDSENNYIFKNIPVYTTCLNQINLWIADFF